jgi:Domain of unknown function (DUF5134)
MTSPGWLAAGLAALMLLIAASCTARLAISGLRGRHAEPDADALHVIMGVAMAGMLEPRLSPCPATTWQAVFAAAAAWFTWQAVRARSRRRPAPVFCEHPAPHALECAAMIYMLLPATHGSHAAMTGMNGATALANPALGLILALFMLGYILWTTDQLASRPARQPFADTQKYITSAALAPGGLHPAPAPPSGSPAPAVPLAPRFATCYKITMSIAMAYMLITML